MVIDVNFIDVPAVARAPDGVRHLGVPVLVGSNACSHARALQPGALKGIVYYEPTPRQLVVIYRWWFGNSLTKNAFRGTFRTIGLRDLTWINPSGVTGRADRKRLDMLGTVEELRRVLNVPGNYSQERL
jgi:hypothetical protein